MKPCLVAYIRSGPALLRWISLFISRLKISFSMLGAPGSGINNVIVKNTYNEYRIIMVMHGIRYSMKRGILTEDLPLRLRPAVIKNDRLIACGAPRRVGNAQGTSCWKRAGTFPVGNAQGTSCCTRGAGCPPPVRIASILSRGRYIWTPLLHGSGITTAGI